MLVGDLAATAIDELVAVTGPGSGSPLVWVELRHMGGALSRTAPPHGAALAPSPSSYTMFAVGMAPTPEARQVAQAHADRVAAAMLPYESGHYSNFTEDSGGAGRFFGGEAWNRLRAVKAVQPREPVPREPRDPARRTADHPRPGSVTPTRARRERALPHRPSPRPAELFAYLPAAASTPRTRDAVMLRP